MTAHDRLARAIRHLGDDEAEVALEVVEGMLAGREQYGAIDPVGDTRRWPQEALEEVRDALVYAGAALVRVRRRGER